MFRNLCAALILPALVSAVAAQPGPGPDLKRRPDLQLPADLLILPRPDLIIPMAYKVPGGDLRVSVRNQGSVKSAACKLSIRLFDSAGGEIGQKTIDVPALAPGLTMMLNTPVGSLAPGSRVDLKVDSTNLVNESNENNNTRSFTIPNLPF